MQQEIRESRDDYFIEDKGGRLGIWQVTRISASNITSVFTVPANKEMAIHPVYKFSVLSVSAGRLTLKCSLVVLFLFRNSSYLLDDCFHL